MYVKCETEEDIQYIRSLSNIAHYGPFNGSHYSLPLYYKIVPNNADTIQRSWSSIDIDGTWYSPSAEAKYNEAIPAKDYNIKTYPEYFI